MTNKRRTRRIDKLTTQMNKHIVYKEAERVWRKHKAMPANYGGATMRLASGFDLLKSTEGRMTY